MKDQRRYFLKLLLCGHLLWNMECSTSQLKTRQAQKKQGDASKEISTEIYGVTIDSIEKLPDIVEALGKLSRKPTARIVFERAPAHYYKEAVHQIHTVSFVMGELVDSVSMKKYTVKEYKRRTAEYLETLGAEVDIWEVGNEVNGEWLGKTSSVVAKMRESFKLVKERGAQTALTLFYNEGCWKMPSEEMFLWAQRNVPREMKEKLDFVFISYYNDECNPGQPNWQRVFDRLGEMFPNSKIGFGEVGTKIAERKVEVIGKYYSLKIRHPRYVGGYFWWYFLDDMVPTSKPLWSVLNATLRQ